MQSRKTTDVVLQALLMAVWRRKPKDKVLVHSMGRRGNCHDNTVAERVFNLLKLERIRRTVYRSRDDARQDVFETQQKT
jgi:putative transposase